MDVTVLSDATETAVIVPVPALEPVVGEFRRRLDHSAPWGVPPHVTVCYPFVPPSAVTADTIAALPTVPAFECTFREVRWFGDDVVWLAPAQDGPFRALTAEVMRRFPDHPPYGGAFDPVPHLTIGSTRLGNRADLRAAGAAVEQRLPVTVTIDRLLLIAGTDADNSWRTVAELTF